jgi:hypothetical protein
VETHPLVQSPRAWHVSLIIAGSIELIVTEQGKEVLYAQFSDLPIHPRALLFILEGMAMWIGMKLYVVIYADSPVHPTLGLGRAGDQWPEDNPLLEFVFVEREAETREGGS